MPDTTPDNVAYLISGLGVGLGIVGLYIVSLALRFRSAAKDIRIIKQLQEN